MLLFVVTQRSHLPLRPRELGASFVCKTPAREQLLALGELFLQDRHLLLCLVGMHYGRFSARHAPEDRLALLERRGSLSK